MSSLFKTAMSYIGFIEDQRLRQENNDNSYYIDDQMDEELIIDEEVSLEFQDTKNAVKDIKRKLETVPKKKSIVNFSHQASAISRLGLSLVEPKSFDDAKVLADKFATKKPVVMDLGGTNEDLARRLLDFASGVCYVLDGKMQKVSPRIFILCPRTLNIPKSKISDIKRVMRV